KGDYKEAIEDFNNALRLKASYVQAYNNRAASKYKLEDYKGAVDDCNKAILLQDDFGPAYLNRGIAYEMLRKEDKACEDWNKAASLGLKNGKTFAQESCN
ncbi:MAG: tetratricopeptide repeat protein, partial [Flavobacteriales bacterium]|nr:tetratricopeptide repeat protein [Flavobacteriales bacterium]